MALQIFSAVFWVFLILEYKDVGDKMNERMTRAWAEVDLGALAHNYKTICAALQPGCRFLGVVKSNAYGHGAVAVAKTLESLGCAYLAVACLTEAQELREAGVRLPILLLGRSDPELAEELQQAEVTQCISDLETARALSQHLHGPLRCHLKLDTGMGRLGFDGMQDFDTMLQVMGLKNLDFEGAFTHFAKADEADGEAYTRMQFDQFIKICTRLEEKTGHKFSLKHCANSGAVINYPWSQLDMVRPGLALYGYYNCLGAERLSLQPVMQLKTRVAQIKTFPAGKSVGYGGTWTAQQTRQIAVLSVGYGDGYFRLFSNRAFVDIGGHRAPVVGRVCMDMIMVDVTGLPVRVNDVAVVYGGKAPINELAELAGTISYELCCDISPRVPRIYTDTRQAE